MNEKEVKWVMVEPVAVRGLLGYCRSSKHVSGHNTPKKLKLRPAKVLKHDVSSILRLLFMQEVYIPDCSLWFPEVCPFGSFH